MKVCVSVGLCAMAKLGLITGSGIGVIIIAGVDCATIIVLLSLYPRNKSVQ